MSRPAPSPVPSTVVTDDGAELRVATWPGERRGVVAAHGITSNHLTWAATADALAGEWEVVAPDLRGRADSALDAGQPDDESRYGIRRHADDIAAVAQAAGLDRVVVVGHSMGGYVAEQVAVRHPELVAALLLVDGGYSEVPPGVDMRPFLEVLFGATLQRLRGTFPDVAAFLAPMRALAQFEHPDDWSDYAERLYLHDLTGSAGRFRAKTSETAVTADYLSVGDPTLLEDLASIRCPVHLIRAERGILVTGDEPQLIPDVWVERFRGRVPQLTEEQVPRTNHFTVVGTARGGALVADRVRDIAARALDS